MTDPSQYFRGRTVQEQMNEVIGYVDVRSAEVATDAIASDVAQVHSDAADAHADALAAAASAAAAAGTLTNAVKKTGEASQSIAGDIAVAGDLSGGTVTVPTPVNNTDAASKKYVDDADALKMNISDINSYAVGLTGNQGPITGLKTFIDQPSGHRINTRLVTGASNYFTIMNCGLRTDGTNTQVLALVYAGNFGLIQIREPNAGSINVTDIIGTLSTSLYFALYTDGTMFHIGVKQTINESRAFSGCLLCATKGNYGLNSGDITLEINPVQVDPTWTLIGTTE